MKENCRKRSYPVLIAVDQHQIEQDIYPDNYDSWKSAKAIKNAGNLVPANAGSLRPVSEKIQI
ncbi:MAG TPA: hypothetical protein PLP17_03410 [Oligoflexia bacterium]|nr:hypothetical protein [Oligoflexia bacterium]